MTNPNKLSLKKLGKIAEASSGAFLLYPRFWLGNWKFLALGLISVAGVYYLSPFTHQSEQGKWVLLTWAVHFLAVWGYVRTAFALSKTQIDTAIVYYVERRGEDYLERIHANGSGVQQLDKVKIEILPHNRSVPLPSSLRLFQNIFAEARNRRFESSVTLAEPCREEALEDIFRLHTLQKIALWLGILGTFVGLLIAIQGSELRSFQAKAGQDFIHVIGKMFDGLLVSFSASVAGLEAAVILGFCLLILRKKQEQYFQGLEQAVVTALSAARNAINKDVFLSDLRDATDELRRVRQQFTGELKNVRVGLSSLQEQLLQQTQLIDSGLKELIKTGVSFEAFRRDVGRKQEKVIDEIAKSVDPVSLRTTLQESVSKAGLSLSEAVTPKVSLISNHLASFNDLILVLKKVLDENRVSIAQNLNSFSGQVKDNLSRNTETVRDISVRVNNLSARIDDLRMPLSTVKPASAEKEFSIRAFISRLRW